MRDDDLENARARALETMKPLAVQYLTHEPGHNNNHGLIPLSDEGPQICREACEKVKSYASGPQALSYFEEAVDSLFVQVQAITKPAVVKILALQPNISFGDQYDVESGASATAQDAIKRITELGFVPEAAEQLLGAELMRLIEKRTHGRKPD